MPSPFPGMNPYLERAAVWSDFHLSFLYAAHKALAGQLVPHYIVKIDEHVFMREPHDEEQLLVGRGDALVSDQGNVARPPTGGTQVLMAPTRIELDVEEVDRLAFLEVRDREELEIITVIELLSPSNKKPGPDRERYCDKRFQLLRSPVHFVEIDLLRAWPRMPMRKLSPCDYCVVVSRAEERPEAGSWPIQLPDPLPVVPVPLSPGKPTPGWT